MDHERSPFTFRKNGEEFLDDEFMVVPIFDQDPLLASVQFIFEDNLAGVTGTILSPPVSDFGVEVDGSRNYCTNDGGGGGGRRSDDFVIVDSTSPISKPSIQQTDFIQSDINDRSVQYYDFDFANVQSEVPAENAFMSGETDLNTPQQRQITELNDPDAAWVAENADLAFLDQFAPPADEQQHQLLDELVRIFQDQQPPADAYDGDASDTEQMDDTDGDPSDMLEEIYREVQQLEDYSSATEISDDQTNTDRSWSRPSSVLLTAYVTPGQRPVAPKMEKFQQLHHQRRRIRSRDLDTVLADHDFGAAKRGRPPGSSSRKRGSLRGQAVVEKKKRFQNREAALRYRLKKKAEQIQKESELEQLQKRNQFLKNESHSLTAEVEYLKELLIEIRKLKCQ